MCVPSRSLGRAGFLGALAAAACFAPAAPEPAAAAATDGGIPLPQAPANMTAANARAAAIAARSPFVQNVYGSTEALARSIEDAPLRESVLALLHDPAPRFMRAYPTTEARERMRATLVAGGFVAADAPLEGIFPPNTLGRDTAPQPFWSTPGSGLDSHHSYPGGLAVHELFNARMAVGYSQQYDRLYPGYIHPLVRRDVVVGAALYHDILKSVVFQWNDDGTPLKEILIGGTGAHHVLSGAEAIARGRDPDFVIAL
ncbi:MAG: hypothetical protein JOY59_11100, partial [Candidatus Eremiobacteraeota bacterium]|nr:hypothetical protein [Candidatus Eremiobacteraeota bacterium]